MSTKNNAKLSEDLVVTTIRIPRDTLARLQQIAANEHRTLSQEVRRLVYLRIQECAPLEQAS